MINLFLVLLFGITESCECNQCFSINTNCYSQSYWDKSTVVHAGTGNRVKVLRQESWIGIGNAIDLNGVDNEGRHDNVCVDTVDSTEFVNGWVVSIEGDDALWADTFTVIKEGHSCKKNWASFTWGASNKDGWCLSTDPTDGQRLKNDEGCGNVPGGKCYRTKYVSDNGSVYTYNNNYSLFGRRRVEAISYEDLLITLNGKSYHVDKNGNAVGQAVDDGFNTVPQPVTIAPSPGSTFGPTCKEISKLTGLTSEVLCSQCGDTGYCKAKYKKKENKCKCKKLKCKECKKDQTCCLTNPEGCTWNPTAKEPCA